MWARDGDSYLEDWGLLLSKNPIKVENCNILKVSGKLLFRNEKLAKDNFTRLKNLNLPIIQVDAQHNNSQAESLSAENMGGLQTICGLR